MPLPSFDKTSKLALLVVAVLGIITFCALFIALGSKGTPLNDTVSKFPLKLSFLEDTHYAYLMLMGGSFFFPFILSFDKKVAFYKSWPALIPALLLTGLFFWPLDIVYTVYGIWGFNPDYYSWSFLGLPDGEWLFFLIVPYCCVFIYACLNAYIERDLLASYQRYLDWFFLTVFLLVGFSNLGRAYTGVKFLMPACLLILNVWVLRTSWRSRFYLAFFVSCVPFALVNGVLTGGFLERPIVLYNDSHNLSSVLGSRMVSIPFDDFAYNFLLLLMCVNWFEYFRGKYR